MSAALKNLFLLVGALLVTVTSSQGQLTSYDPVGARSFSGQFVVHVDPAPAGFGRAPDFSGEPDMLKLEASLLAISCERIKQALATELGDKSQPRGKIFISLHAARSADEEITFTTERFKDAWAYRLDVPNPVKRTRLIRAIIGALLQERANRNSRDRSAELPLWLVEGMTEILLTARGAEVILPPPQWNLNRLQIAPVVFEVRHTNIVTRARTALGERGPMSLDEISWPKEDQLTGPDASAFTHSSQLFIGELLRLKDGTECFSGFLNELPKYLNWQTAFLRGFRPHFERQIDVEKWWTLKIVSFTGREPGAVWTVDETWTKLEDLIPVQVEVRRKKGELPVPAQVPLSTVIREWDFVRQANTLRAKVNELSVARVRAAEEFVPLLDEYRQVLQDYLATRSKLGMTILGRPKVRALERETLMVLDALEQKRRIMRPSTPDLSNSAEGAAAPASVSKR